ncbi:MAG: hypothetical protein ACRD68_01470 [Pyrinomonadaceae bacterium]
MTTKAKKILITTESREVWIVRRRGGESVRGFCPRCAAEVEFLTLDTAVALAGVGSRQIHRWIEGGRVHFAETPAGSVLICPRSLSERPAGARRGKRATASASPSTDGTKAGKG